MSGEFAQSHVSSKFAQAQRGKAQLKSSQAGRTNPTSDKSDLDEVGTLRLDPGESLFDYSPLRLNSLRHGRLAGTPMSRPVSSNRTNNDQG